jgi:hypothetical protein
MCFSFWGVPRGDSRLTKQSATWLVNLRGVSISPWNTPKAKTHSVVMHKLSHYEMSIGSLRVNSDQLMTILEKQCDLSSKFKSFVNFIIQTYV